jgi:hypothetical protein
MSFQASGAPTQTVWARKWFRLLHLILSMKAHTQQNRTSKTFQFKTQTGVRDLVGFEALFAELSQAVFVIKSHTNMSQTSHLNVLNVHHNPMVFIHRYLLLWIALSRPVCVSKCLRNGALLFVCPLHEISCGVACGLQEAGLHQVYAHNATG